jgi:hypothetical protein
VNLLQDGRQVDTQALPVNAVVRDFEKIQLDLAWTSALLNSASDLHAWEPRMPGFWRGRLGTIRNWITGMKPYSATYFFRETMRKDTGKC